METKKVIYDLRTKMGLSQEELAEYEENGENPELVMYKKR